MSPVTPEVISHFLPVYYAPGNVFSVSHDHFSSQKDSEGYYNAQLRDEETQTTDTQPVNGRTETLQLRCQTSNLKAPLLLSSRSNQKREARDETG